MGAAPFSDYRAGDFTLVLCLCHVRPNGQSAQTDRGVAAKGQGRRANKFAGSFYLSGSAKAGKVCQLFDAVDNRLSDIPGGIGKLVLRPSGKPAFFGVAKNLNCRLLGIVSGYFFEAANFRLQLHR
jgi:hypothetical protein